jgi:hypothetical protein
MQPHVFTSLQTRLPDPLTLDAEGFKRMYYFIESQNREQQVTEDCLINHGKHTRYKGDHRKSGNHFDEKYDSQSRVAASWSLVTSAPSNVQLRRAAYPEDSRIYVSV